MALYLDDFARPDQSGLGSFPGIPGGLPWEVISGAWSILSDKPHTTTLVSDAPIAVIPTDSADVDMSVAADGGDALYARVADANNWLRARLNRFTVTSGHTHYELVAEKCVGAVVTEIGSCDLLESEAPGTIRVVITGTVFEVYLPYEYLARISVFETAHATETKHGIGRGSTDQSVQSLDDFRIYLNFAPNAPTLSHPADGQTVYHDQDNFPTFSATDPDAGDHPVAGDHVNHPDPGDQMSAYALKRVISGVTRWWKAATETWEVAETFNERVSEFPALFETIPIGAFLFNALGEVTWSVAVKDAAGLVSPYSDSRTFTIEASDPLGPTIPLTDPAVLAALQGVSHPRHLEFAYELLDSGFAHKAWLAGVTSGSVGNNSAAEIKRTARLTLRDGLDDIAPSDLVRLWVRVKVPAVWGWSDPT